MQPRALSAAERATILYELHIERFVDASPTEVRSTLLDEGRYFGSILTFYRLLRQVGESRERRRQATHPATVKSEMVAFEPNQVWSWDITELRGPPKRSWYHHCVILDIFSRSVVGWKAASRESAPLAEVFIRQTGAKQAIGRDRLTIHADRSSSMTSKPVAFLLAVLGFTQPLPTCTTAPSRSFATSARRARRRLRRTSGTVRAKAARTSDTAQWFWINKTHDTEEAAQ